MAADRRQRLCLTTRHGKERALARPFAALALELEVCACDTDQLGSFSGDIARPEDALETCRRKALLGLEATGLSLGLASEGSFGPHPAVPLLPIGQELLILIDLDRQLTVAEQHLELRTNYSQTRIGEGEDPTLWLQQIGFPSHGVIARPASPECLADHPELLVKGIRSAAELAEAMRRCRDADPQDAVWLESDMRAHMNPTRMASIRRLGFKLVRRLRTPCPSCGSPGWGQVDSEAGLPCSWCGEPTELSRSEIWACVSCHERRSLPRRDGLLAADPGQCQWCNP